ncbi:transposase subunit [Symbiobacterium thermophilum IAM 14863]|uniref:Transposase subunit n=1 Tax=Symbiobacterium thermophilum (strain DSM 24528 / JCM 14929 / IAM 14863 / T) TaxID=292459 RepID=Q67PV9_SYMTH|nr:transposase subunit [Symbiobacterium thermophilum IAM 14863]
MRQQQQPELQSLSFEERLELLVDQEWLDRQNRRLARLLKEAKFRVAACMEDVDYQHPRGLDRTVMRSLAACQWVEYGQHILIAGPTGVGKTFIACALGNAACRHGYTVRYYRVPRLLAELATARVDGSLRRILNTLARTDVLILDDWGLAPISVAESRDLLEVIDDRTQARSTVIASQLPIETWHSVIGDATVADAILDRLVHGAHKLNLKGESMRKIANLHHGLALPSHRHFAPSPQCHRAGRMKSETAVDLDQNRWSA